jgi:hypothetical protein
MGFGPNEPRAAPPSSKAISAVLTIKIARRRRGAKYPSATGDSLQAEMESSARSSQSALLPLVSRLAGILCDSGAATPAADDGHGQIVNRCVRNRLEVSVHDDRAEDCERLRALQARPMQFY